MFYREDAHGQIFEKGSRSRLAVSFIADGHSTALTESRWSFDIYYSMFGYQRVGDSSGGGDSAPWFLLGGSETPTLNGEGLSPGRPQSCCSACANCRAYDPHGMSGGDRREGLRRMCASGRRLLLLTSRENYPSAVPDGVERDPQHLPPGTRGRARRAENCSGRGRSQEVLAAGELPSGSSASPRGVERHLDTEQRRDGLAAERSRCPHESAAWATSAERLKDAARPPIHPTLPTDQGEGAGRQRTLGPTDRSQRRRALRRSRDRPPPRALAALRELTTPASSKPAAERRDRAMGPDPEDPEPVKTEVADSGSKDVEVPDIGDFTEVRVIDDPVAPGDVDAARRRRCSPGDPTRHDGRPAPFAAER